MHIIATMYAIAKMSIMVPDHVSIHADRQVLEDSCYACI